MFLGIRLRIKRKTKRSCSIERDWKWFVHTALVAQGLLELTMFDIDYKDVK